MYPLTVTVSSSISVQR